MANENKFLNIGKKIIVAALPIIIQKSSETLQEWLEKKGNEKTTKSEDNKIK